MGSPRSGYKELVYIETDKVSVTLKGSASHPMFQNAEVSETKSRFEASCYGNFSVALYSLSEQKAEHSGRMWSIKSRVRPLFYEQQNYEIIVESKKDNSSQISVWHDNINIREKITPVGHSGNILSGLINFDNNIGYSDFVIRLDGNDYLTLKLEVFPSKIDYKEDYQAMIDDVTKEVYSLIFDFLKKTYQSFRLNSSLNNTPAEFFAVISRIFEDMLRATDLVLSQPHHILSKTYENMPAHKIKRTDAKTMSWIQKHPNKIRFNEGKITALDKPLTVKKYVTYDTRENRFTKFILQSTAKKLQSFKNVYCSQQDIDAEIVKQIDKMQKELVRRINTSFLHEVGTYTPSAVSLVFSMAPGYRELYKHFLMLVHGLTLTGDLFSLSVKDVAVLYEYWCFIKLNSILKRDYELVSSDIIKTRGSGLSVALVKGQASKVKYKNPANGEEIVLAYNPLEKGSPTTLQKPDNVLSLKKNSGSINEYEYVFDAKYRIDMALEGTDYKKRYRTPGPVEDTINTMHRYRDAIVSPNDIERTTKFGAYVLFPYKNIDEYKKHHFYKSIEKVNIGGLPFLPSATDLVNDMLTNLVMESADSAFGRATLPVGIDEKLAKVDWEHRDVLIGTLKDKNQLDVCLEHNFYHIPKKNLSAEKLPIHYVALYQSKEKFGANAGILYYGEVIFSQIVKRSEITEIPKNSQEEYYRFGIKKWEKLDEKIAIDGSIGRTKTDTNLFLLQNCDKSSDLLINSEEQYRLTRELKRILGDEDIAVDNSELLCKHSRISFDDDNIYVDGTKFCSRKEFNKHSSSKSRELIKIIA